MHYISSGQGSPVILIHGLFGNLDNLKALGKSLEAHHTVIRIDIPNHGLSEHSATMEYPELAQAVIDLMDQLAIAKAHIVGHSMGGKIAMATALAHPERVLSLIAADIAPVSYEPRHDLVFSALTGIELNKLSSRTEALAQLIAAGIDEGTAQFLLKNLARGESGFFWKLNLAGLTLCYPSIIGWHNQNPHTIKQFTGPSLFIRGGDSDYVISAHTEAILAQFPQVQAKTIVGTGHWLHAQKPAMFNRIVAEFISNSDEN